MARSRTIDLGRSSYDTDGGTVTERTRVVTLPDGSAKLMFSSRRADGEAYSDDIWLTPRMAAKLVAVLTA